MSLIKEIILQLFFVLAPFVAFNIYYRDKLRNFSRTFIIMISSVCMFLSMTFASSLIEGVFFDMRYVLMFFSLVYGGVQGGLIVLFEFAVYRLYLGGEGKWIALLHIAFFFSISLFFCGMYKAAQRKSQVIFIAGIIFSIVPSVLAFSYFPDYIKQNLTFHIFVIPFQTSVGIWLLMSLFSKAVSDKELFIKQAQNERTEAISQVAASLAHEVRNPLTAVKGFLKLIMEKHQESDKIKQYAKISLEEIQRTEHILSEYLSISKPTSLGTEPEPMNLSEQLHIIYDVMLPHASLYNVELKIHTPQSIIMVMGNAGEFKQVLVNFIKNAVEACLQQPNARVMVKLMAIGNSAILTIHDNGVGMSADQISRLGSIYYSTKTNGTGLGLTYSYRVIHAFGGNVAVTSKVNNGTKFTITFPLIDRQ